MPFRKWAEAYTAKNQPEKKRRRRKRSVKLFGGKANVKHFECGNFLGDLRNNTIKMVNVGWKSSRKIYKAGWVESRKVCDILEEILIS